MPPVPPIVVFCDLDDTLFESRTFYVDAYARGALDRIREKQVPLVLCSSKTRAECELIHHALGIQQPFVCENGAAVFVPRGYFGFTVGPARDAAGYEVVEFGKTHEEIVVALHRAARRSDARVVGFGDMSVEDVANDCELSLLQARLAKLREYSELFQIVTPGPIPRLFRALRAADLECMHRGRYHHVGAARSDIGAKFLRGLYRRTCGDILTVAFGDHRCAVPLLRQVDLPLVVRSNGPVETAHLLAQVPAARLSVADSLGTWAEVILDIADAVQRNRHLRSS